MSFPLAMSEDFIGSKRGIFLTIFRYYICYVLGGVRAFSGSTAAMSTGKVTQVIGAVVDVQVSIYGSLFLDRVFLATK